MDTLTTASSQLQHFDWHYFIILFIGTTDVTYAISMALFGFIGVVLGIFINFALRGKSNPATPDKFNLKYSIQDNWLRYVISFILTLVFMRIMEEVAGKEVTTAIALGLGLASDKLIEVVFKVMNGYSWNEAFSSIFRKAE